MNAEQFLLNHNLDNVVLNAKEFPANTPENAGKWVYASDTMEKYAAQKLSEHNLKEVQNNTPKCCVENRNKMEWIEVKHHELIDFDYSSLPEMNGSVEGKEYGEEMLEVSQHVILLLKDYSEVCVGYIAVSNDDMISHEERFFCEVDGLGSEPISNLIAWMPTPSTHTVYVKK
jgi:hypothetical protein